MKHISLKVPEVIRRNFRFSTLDFLFIILYACAGRRGYQIILRRRSILVHSGSVHMYLNFIYGRWGHIIQQIADSTRAFSKLTVCIFLFTNKRKDKNIK